LGLAINTPKTGGSQMVKRRKKTIPRNRATVKDLKKMAQRPEKSML
jgi:hypothetical protein